MIIRDATIKDMKACHKLSHIKEFELPAGDFISLRFFKRHLGSQLFLVAEYRKKVIGYALGDPFEGRYAAMLWYITIKDSYRGKGVGDNLLKEFEKRCKSIGIRWIVLYSPSFNKKSVKFYKARGYAIGKEQIECIKGLF